MFITKITYSIRSVAEFLLNSEEKPIISIKHDENNVNKIMMEADITDLYKFDPIFKNEIDKILTNQEENK